MNTSSPTLLNTTFVVHESIETEFLSWARETYLKAIADEGRYEHPLLLRVLAEVAPDTKNFAVQMRCATLGDAQEWHDGRGQQLRDQMAGRWRDNALTFSTFMEIL